jgi:hypothetical protein
VICNSFCDETTPSGSKEPLGVVEENQEISIEKHRL